jgi:predicted nucleic acid-binding protein
MNLPSRVFVDTSFLIALLNSRDADHAAAVSLQADLKT